jgi:hypothetical protein
VRPGSIEAEHKRDGVGTAEQEYKNHRMSQPTIIEESRFPPPEQGFQLLRKKDIPCSSSFIHTDQAPFVPDGAKGLLSGNKRTSCLGTDSLPMMWRAVYRNHGGGRRTKRSPNIEVRMIGGEIWI